MLSYCLKLIKNTQSKNRRAVKTKNGTLMLLSKQKMWDSKNSNFIKEQKASGLLSSIGIRAPLNQIFLS